MSEPGTQKSATYDPQALLARLRSSEERFLKAVAGVPEKLSTICPHPNAWCIREVAEHVAAVESMAIAILKQAKMRDTEPDLEMDERILNGGLDRSRKFEAPERFRPAGRFKSLSEAVAAFKKERKATLEFMAQYTGDLRKLGLQHPIGPVDGYQYMLLITAHPERHALQIDEIKNDPAYRKAGK